MIFKKRYRDNSLTLYKEARFGQVNDLSKMGFSLIEILIVISIMGLVSGLIAVQFSGTTQSAEATIVTSELHTIREAFTRFRRDCYPSTGDLDEIRKYGLWPLFSNNHPNGGVNYSNYDVTQASGWAGPYLRSEGELTIDADPDRSAGRKTVGQEIDASGVRAPIILSPWNNHYRVMGPKDSSNIFLVRRLLLVCLGELASQEWDTGTGRLIATDVEAQEQNLLTTLQNRVDHYLLSPESLSPSMTAEEALDELRVEFPSYTFVWLMPSEARE